MDSRLIVIRKSALREEERDSQEDKNSSREAGVLADLDRGSNSRGVR